MLFQHCSYVTRRALTLSAISLLLIGAYSNAFAQKEKVFRWSSAGDFLTFDVHAQNESLNSAANAAVYEALGCQRRGIRSTGSVQHRYAC